MLQFPKSTQFHKRIPKQKFYEKLDVSLPLKRSFIDQIGTVYWEHKFAPETLHVEKGKRVTEIEVFLIHLTEKQLDEAVLRQIDKEIPYHILFVLEYEGQLEAWIGYKEAAEKGKNAFQVGRYYHTPWMPQEKLCFSLEGLTMDALYDSLVRQIAGETLQQESKAETLQESVEKETKRLQLQKEIDRLEKLARKEKQPKKKFELVQELNRLKKEV